MPRAIRELYSALSCKPRDWVLAGVAFLQTDLVVVLRHSRVCRKGRAIRAAARLIPPQKQVVLRTRLMRIWHQQCQIPWVRRGAPVRLVLRQAPSAGQEMPRPESVEAAVPIINR